MKLVLATGNPKKVEEVRRILAGLDVELLSLIDLDVQQAEETGDTFEENALLKARAAAAQAGLPALADDSGLEVEALGGDPGVRSARYAGIDGPPEQVDRANNARLIRELTDVPAARRTARFVCVAALALPDGRTWTVRGTMEGRIVDEPRGGGGFGYDPHFVADGETRTNAELSPDEKDARSHRGAAFRGIRRYIQAAHSDTS